MSSSFIYKLLERISVKIVGFVVTIVLGRLISPNDFGIIAIISVFVNLSYAFIEGGFSSALIQKKGTDDLDYSTVFCISLISSILLISILFIASPHISRFYNNEGITKPLRVYSLSLFLSAINSVQIAHMQKEMNFKAILKCSLISSFISGLVGIVLAFKGFGIWALVIYYFSNIFCSSISMIFQDKWFPNFSFSATRGKTLFGFGWKMLLSSLLCSVYNDFRTLVIGKKFTPSDLGYYNRGQQFPEIISNTFDNAVQSVMFPTFADVQDSKETMRAYLKLSVSFSFGLVVPAMLGMFVIAPVFVSVVLTDTWLPCVPYLRCICIADMSIPLISSFLVVIKASGKSGMYLKLEIVRRILMVLVLFVGIRFDSVLSIAISFAIGSWLDFVLVVYVARKVINLKLTDVVACTYKSFFAALVMFFLINALSSISENPYIILLLQMVIGVVSYGVCCALFKSELYIYGVKKIRGMKKRVVK